MFSARSHFDRTPNPVARLLEEKRRAGRPILDLTESNPTRCDFRYPEAAIREALVDARAMTYEPDPRGLPEARAAIAAYYRDLGAVVSTDRILVTASTSEAYAFLFRLLCDPGDAVLVPVPSYPLFDFLTALDGVRPLPYAVRYDGAWHLDLPSVRGALTDRTRAIVVVSPHNPTGAFLKRDELSVLESLCAERDAALVCDEVFADYGVGAARDRVATAAGDRRALTFSLSGLSKAAGLPQVKLGWIAAGGPEPAVREAMARLELIADTFLSVNMAAQLALASLLGGRRDLQTQILVRLARNRDVLAQAARGAAWSALSSEGGWTAVLEVPRRRSEEAWVLRLLGEHDVLLHPGFFYDFPRPGYLVVSLLPAEDVFREGVTRLARVLGSAD